MWTRPEMQWRRVDRVHYHVILFITRVWTGLSRECPGGWVCGAPTLRPSDPTSCRSACVLAVAEVSRRRRRCYLLCSQLLRAGRATKKATGLSRSVTLARRLKAKTATGKSDVKRTEPVKVSPGTLMSGDRQERRSAEHVVAASGNSPLEFPLGKR